MYRIVFLILSSALIFSGCKQKDKEIIPLPYYNEPTFTPIFLKNNELVKNKITHTINSFSFLNQDSVMVNEQTIEGKIHVANFIFTSCGSICPTMTKNLKTVSDGFANDKNLVFLSFSVTPWIDKPYVLKRYKEQNHIDNGNWHFLTGSKAEIYDLARKSYFAEEDIGFSKDSTEFLHTEHFILVDKNKRIRGIYNGTLALEMQQLIDDIKTLKSTE
ncbi:SCO family protein [Pedobacter jejuensis]|uniref:SCO family protein n=1 Tax=Pedobacter jejuensis TaxID=1268550 RepID=A0A3N0C001_9SPHI|nr:SCO family protein [Pedobacter jejuensis]RNL55511.1 SCO family protein [Pedobacter jejuensis]